MNIQEARIDYLHYISVVDQKSMATIHSYEQDLKAYEAYMKERGIMSMEDITYQAIQDYLSYLTSDHYREEIQIFWAKKPSSINHMITSIHMFHRYITMTYPAIIDPSIHVRGKKTNQKLPIYFNMEAITQLLDSFQDNDQDIFHKAVLELLYGCGLRVSEVCSLRLNQLHIEQGFLRVIGKGDKERMVPMHQRCIIALRKYMGLVRDNWERRRDAHVFINKRGNPLTRQYVHTLIKQKLTEQNLDSRLSAHSFRHSFASHLLDGGADLRVVQELLGHSDISTTQIYTHIQHKRLKNVYQSFHPRSEKSKDLSDKHK